MYIFVSCPHVLVLVKFVQQFAAITVSGPTLRPLSPNTHARDGRSAPDRCVRIIPEPWVAVCPDTMGLLLDQQGALLTASSPPPSGTVPRGRLLF